MAMQNKELATEVIDRGEKLPFLLQLYVGGERDIVPLVKLCKSLHFLSECMYEVQELKPLRLRLQSEQAVHVLFIWNKVYEGKKQDTQWQYSLNNKQSTALLYEHGKTDYIYPWRCGIYHFEVIVEEERYYGAFRITPKNFHDNQLTLIQNTVRSVLGSLIVDRGHYKKTFSMFTDLEDHSYMQTIRWLSQHVSSFKKLYAFIEREDGYEAVYQSERRFRKPTQRTIRINERTPTKEGAKYWNRRMVATHNSLANQFIKQKTIEFLQLVHKLLQFLIETIDKLQQMEESSKREKQAIQSILQTIEKNGSVTERDKQKYRNIDLLKDTDRKKITVKIKEYSVLYSIIEDLAFYLSALLCSPFWSGISSTESLPSSITHIHRQLIQLIETSYDKTSSYPKEPLFLFVYKPTFLIYEYYVYLVLLMILQEMEFIAHTPIIEQIQSFFYLDGLQDGTTIILEKDDMQLHVVFNELIETHPLIALSKGSHFYNGEDSKKPDIRIDYYKLEAGGVSYQSSIIVEVKYSPMYNIFQPVGNTKATEQMYKYWSIKYVLEEDGRRVFHRRAIYEVVCVYPGSQVHAKKIESGCGIFLQFYPYQTKHGIEKIMGKREFIRLFKEWLQLG